MASVAVAPAAGWGAQDARGGVQATAPPVLAAAAPPPADICTQLLRTVHADAPGAALLRKGLPDPHSDGKHRRRATAR